MKLIIDAAPERLNKLSVVDGDNVIVTYNIYATENKRVIDEIFEKWYIEAVYTFGPEKYVQKFVDYITENHKGVEVL